MKGTRRAVEFFDVDLRFQLRQPVLRSFSEEGGCDGHGGVPAKDANGETANSWEYCRQWIDRVEPLFVCILGQRYGWVPEPDERMKAEG